MSSIVKLSPSGIENYKNCSWMYYLKEHCGYKGLAEIQNELGKAAHSFVSGLHKPHSTFDGLPAGKNTSFVRDNIRGQWVPYWHKHMQNISSSSVSREILAELSERGEKVGPAYIELYLSHPRAMLIDSSRVEIAFSNIHIPTTSVNMNMRIDQIRPHKEDGGDVIVDLKFSESMTFNPRDNFALRCYSIGFREIYKREESAVSIWNVPDGPKNGIKVAKLTSEDLEDTTNEIRKVGLRILNRRFNLPKDDVTCSSCSTKEMCRKPGRSEELFKLAHRNTDHRGILPQTRTEMILEKVLEKPEEKTIPFHDEQSFLDLN